MPMEFLADRMKLSVFCGPPGSGKTTAAREFAAKNNATLRSYDDMPGANGRVSVMGDWLRLIHEDLATGSHVVCDGLFLAEADRMNLLEAVKDIDCRKDLVVLLPPLAVCLERNRGRKARLPDFVVEQAHKAFEHPTEREAWDLVISKEGLLWQIKRF